MYKTITGRLTPIQKITGQLTTPEVVPPPVYEGDYIVTPKAYEVQVLSTQGYLMEHDVTVLEVPYWETSNIYGVTVYIAQPQRRLKNGY